MYSTVIYGKTLYCNGYYSCFFAIVSDITNVYAYGQRASKQMKVVDNVENVYCGIQGCLYADINNVDSDLYCYGCQSLPFAS